MTTELAAFSDAYASITVARYEPLILRWISLWSLATVADVTAWRAPKAASIREHGQDLPTALRSATGRRGRPDRAPLLAAQVPKGRSGDFDAVDVEGNRVPAQSVQRISVRGYPDAVAVDGDVFPTGILRRLASGSGGFAGVLGRSLPGRKATRAAGPNPQPAGQAAGPAAGLGVWTVPTVLNKAMGTVPADFDLAQTRRELFGALDDAARSWAAEPGKTSLAEALHIATQGQIYQFLPRLHVEEALSPIGIAHFFRQLYFNLEEGYGPIEQAFTVAPLETLEVVYETVRRQIHEEQLELGSEQVSEQASETKNLDEVSDKVSSMIQRDSSAAMSANVSGGVGVWQGGASASANLSSSTQRSREETSRRLKEVTHRASERITKTYSLKVRDVTDVTTTNLTRRVIRNDSAEPVSYGLRRVLRRVRVKVQDLGPSLVWQVYVRDPGAGLARSRFVHFRTPGEIASPELPPGAPPRPVGGTDTGATSSAVAWSPGRGMAFVTVVVTPGAGRVVTQVSIDSIGDLEGGGKDDLAPSPLNAQQWDAAWNGNTNSYSVKIGILPGDAASVSVNYTYAWRPSDDVVASWQAQVAAARAAIEEKSLQEKFEREKATLTELSKIRARPANDLRREERYEVMNRMVSQLFARGDDPSDPSPLEIEYFHRYFDIDMMFVYTHPSWWRPRYTKVATGFGRPDYAITADSEPARLGASLGWRIQLDGDGRRNEFLNSPWLRACLPIRAGREREAIGWLAKHIEGEVGYDVSHGPLASVLADIETYRQHEGALGNDGADYVTIDTAPGVPEGGTEPEAVYPVVDEYDVTLPTEGFVYDRLLLHQ